MTPDGNRNGIDVLAGESRTGAGLPQSGHLFADRTGVEDRGWGPGPAPSGPALSLVPV